MALVISTDLDPVKVLAFGNWFEFKPGQKRNMQDHFSHFLALEKKHMGFMELPQICEDEPESEEAKEAVARAVQEGRENIVRWLNQQVYNLEVSLQKDYDMAGIKASATKQEARGHLPHYKRLAALQAASSDVDAQALAEIEKLKEQLNGASNSTNTTKTDPRSSNISKSAK